MKIAVKSLLLLGKQLFRIEDLIDLVVMLKLFLLLLFLLLLLLVLVLELPVFLRHPNDSTAKITAVVVVISAISALIVVDYIDQL